MYEIVTVLAYLLEQKSTHYRQIMLCVVWGVDSDRVNRSQDKLNFGFNVAVVALVSPCTKSDRLKGFKV